MSPIIPSRYGHPKYNIFPQKSRSASMGGFKTNQRGTPGFDSKSRRKQRVEESKITVQPNEDEEADNFFSKHLAAARFQRNHRLINVLFSEVVVDQEQASDNEKLNSCKKRVQTLTEYQKKIDTEIVEMNEKFNCKRAKINEDGKKFAEKLADFITSSKKELATLKAAQEVRRQQEVVQRQQAKRESLSNSNVHDSVRVNDNSSESRTQDSQSNETKSNNTEVSMEGVTMNLDQHKSSLQGDSSAHSTDVRQVVEKLVNSVADRI